MSLIYIEMNTSTKFNRDDRKHIAEQIENLKNDQDYIAIFEILMNDKSNTYTQNSNGIFLNLSSVSDRTLDKISEYLKKINKHHRKQEEINIDIIPNDPTFKNNRIYKLSNYEKNILKQRNLKKVLNNDNDYEELKLSSNKNSSKKKNLKKNFHKSL